VYVALDYYLALSEVDSAADFAVAAFDLVLAVYSEDEVLVVYFDHHLGEEDDYFLLAFEVGFDLLQEPDYFAAACVDRYLGVVDDFLLVVDYFLAEFQSLLFED
jgi:hypothetical protein